MNPDQTTHLLRGTRRHAPGREVVATRADQRSLTQQIEQKNAPSRAKLARERLRTMLDPNQLAAALGVKPGELEHAIEDGAILPDATRPSRESGRTTGRFLFAPERLEEHRAAVQASVESGKAAQAARAGRGLVDAGQLARRLGAEVRQVLDTLRRSGVRRDGSRVRRLPGRTLRLPAFVPERVPEIEGILRHHFQAERARAEAAYLEEQRQHEEERRAQAARAAQLRAASGLGDYPALFPEARALARRWIAFLGPTNSGKTYAAMQELMAADTGVYLAPLRLLALEGYEILLDGGMAAAMLTGEETLGEPGGASHVASTIEMLHTRRPVDAAVVDEVQMLGDPQRGHAWTQALVGAPARTLLVCGSPAAEPALRRLAGQLEEPLEVRRFERKAPLGLVRRPVALGALRPGDAVVVFSRRQAHELRQALAATGRRTAMIYGSLSPQVRRTEAARFNGGEAEVLIATDAIGMGLNLNIRRILFGSLRKFTGSAVGWLEPEPMRQIAGRAGRYGKHEVGEVGVLEGVESFDRLATALRRAPAPLDPASFRVFPPAEAVAAVAEGLGHDRLLPTLDYIASSISRRGDFVLRLEEEQREVAGMLDRWAPRLPLAERHRLLGAPVPLGIPRVVDFAREAIQALAHGRQVSLVGELDEVGRLHGYGRLQTLEDLARIATLGRWLARRWPDAVDLETAKALAEEARPKNRHGPGKPPAGEEGSATADGPRGKEQAHRRGGRFRQRKGEGLVGAGSAGSEEVEAREPLVGQPGRAHPALVPAVASSPLLPDPGLILAPEL